MEMEQELEWKKAQSIEIQVDLVSAAKTHLKFLAAVDRKRWLYEGLALERAIFRYNACWLPLLAKHCQSPLLEGPLVVPLDCEWIWHCHRLNPIRYKEDCEVLYGRILDNRNVVSSVDAASAAPSEEIWKEYFPLEPFDLDITNVKEPEERVSTEKCTDYDLISAVRRQAPFFYQVSRPHMTDDRFIEGAVARYKGFLHLIRRNKERGLNSFSVPTYDIDLIWHTHQLHPVSYCMDLMNIMGKVLEHDDTDSDRSKGQKLDVGFTETTKMYEAMFGARYWRAGAMYRGTAPFPVRTTPYIDSCNKKSVPSDENQKLHLPKVDVFEVMIEFVSVRNLPEGHKGSLMVLFSKTQPDAIFNAERSLTVFSETGEKRVASFQCQPTGNLLLELVSAKSSSTIGKTLLSLEDFLSPNSELVLEKWLVLEPSRAVKEGSKEIGLRVAISVTIPTSAPYELRMNQSRGGVKRSCLFPIPSRFGLSRRWTRVFDNAGNMVLSLQLRKRGGTRVVIGVTEPGETRQLLELSDSGWSLMNSPWFLKFPDPSSDDYDGYLLELTGPKTVRLYGGGRLDYETKGYQKAKSEQQHEANLITAFEFSSEHPYGRAAALLDLKSGDVKVKDDWFILPGLLLMFILVDQTRRNGDKPFPLISQHQKQKELPKLEPLPEKMVQVAEAEGPKSKGASGGCGAGGCGGGCGDAIRADGGGCGGCGAGECGGGCGDTAIKANAGGGGCGGCGAGGCGGGCGHAAIKANAGGCGGCGAGGCGGGCGHAIKADAGGCGGCGAGGCGSMVKDSGVKGGVNQEGIAVA